MTTVTWKVSRFAVCAVALLAVSAGLANAAPARVATNTNLRQGPGTNFGVITTAPAGGVVNVIRCGVEWCNVIWAGRPGYMIARNLGMARVRVVDQAPVVVVQPAYPRYYGYGPYYGPRYRYGYRGFYGRRGW